MKNELRWEKMALVRLYQVVSNGVNRLREDRYQSWRFLKEA